MVKPRLWPTVVKLWLQLQAVKIHGAYLVWRMEPVDPAILELHGLRTYKLGIEQQRLEEALRLRREGEGRPGIH